MNDLLRNPKDEIEALDEMWQRQGAYGDQRRIEYDPKYRQQLRERRKELFEKYPDAMRKQYPYLPPKDYRP